MAFSTLSLQTLAGPVQHGTASWYGENFRGRPTASGQIFNPDLMTVAHPYLPFGTRVRVTHQYSGASVVAIVNDRLPSSSSRIIDLSLAAAAQLGMVQSGLAPVRVEVLP